MTISTLSVLAFFTSSGHWVAPLLHSGHTSPFFVTEHLLEGIILQALNAVFVLGLFSAFYHLID